MNGPATISPEQTLALVVGIEAYPRRKGLDLKGPAADALRIARWLRGRGVPAENLQFLISGNAAENLPADLAGVELLSGVIGLDAVASALEGCRRGRSRFLFVFWTGHGIMTADHVRRPLLANYSDTDTHNLNVESLQEHLRSATYSYPPYQVMLFDMCATLFDERLRRESLIDHKFQSGPARADCQQFLLYAAADRQVAENLAVEQTGLYFKELMPILEQETAWPPDMRSVVSKLELRFEELRGKGLTSQEPIYQYWRAPSGKSESKYLGARPSSVDVARNWAMILALCLVPSLLLSEFGLGLAPPWPNRWVVALATVPLPFLVYQGLLEWSASKTRQRLERLLRWSLAASVVTALAYLFLFAQFTYPLPDHWHREIGGFTYTPKAEKYRQENPGIPDRDLIFDMGNDVEQVFGGASLGLMRIVFLGGWLSLFVCGSTLVSVFLILQRHDRRLNEIPA